MIGADWDYMAHGLYNSRPIYDYTEEQERAYWQDFITHLKEMTGKRLKGRLGGGAGYTVRTDDLMAEAGCLYHTSWIIGDQPWPINVRAVRSLSMFLILARPMTQACWPGIARRITSCR
jgi:allantoinase